MNIQELKSTAKAMVTAGKGILAMDESAPTIKKRFDSIGVKDSEENRMVYRELLITTQDLGKYISGAILFDETIRHTLSDGRTVSEVLQQQGIIPGIKVDGGAKQLAGHPGEKITEGLDKLRDRLTEYHDLGARFCKWRAVITIGDEIPSRTCIETNAHALARYAALAQEANLVPIVEPEVLMDGNHTIERCYDVTIEMQRIVFDELYRQGVSYEGMVLKPNMVISGTDCPQQASVEQVAEQTIQCLRNTVPAAVPGIAFLSGGQSDETATIHLNAMNIMGRGMDLPWQLTFSYGRALQHPALTKWNGEKSNISDAQTILLHRARCNGMATLGQYNERIEHEQAA